MIPVRERRYADARTTRRGNAPSAERDRLWGQLLFDVGGPPHGVQWSDRATSPLLRSDFAQSTAGLQPNGDLTDSFVPAIEREFGRLEHDSALLPAPSPCPSRIERAEP